MPTFEALVKSEEGLAFARQVFAESRAGQHPITIASVEALFARSAEALEQEQ